MYCNLVKEMPSARVKIRVFGYRWTSTDSEKIRYVDGCRLILANNVRG
ncbi:hypothetical protein SAMN05660772_02047 [Pasteurella testudinis DSM 23072]|uniref:Uncharacterized protein n=1 Tax=Pasteurella testudinis DSM 23072 TaxID=1122938 RepID=A0A1W1UMU7_9PAST|nr:hypothetical protein SAMN05660772_02047 [Pasteurella testudinis DSM 23072]SUB51485.1 Uncharacterised protein [Pasteurella testudinis]